MENHKVADKVFLRKSRCFGVVGETVKLSDYLNNVPGEHREQILSTWFHNPRTVNLTQPIFIVHLEEPDIANGHKIVMCPPHLMHGVK